MNRQLFDDWPTRYRQWFQSPIGSLVLRSELDLVMTLLDPREDDRILDAGCGNGIFTAPVVARGATVVGLDISDAMLRDTYPLSAGGFFPVCGSMLSLPFPDACFDRTLSVTALEFIAAGDQALAELFRVTRPGGRIVVATLSRLASWATRRTEAAQRDPESVFRDAVFRSPEELMALAPVAGSWRTAVFFDANASEETARRIEESTRDDGRGAFLAGVWTRP